MLRLVWSACALVAVWLVFWFAVFVGSQLPHHQVPSDLITRVAPQAASVCIGYAHTFDHLGMNLDDLEYRCRGFDPNRSGLGHAFDPKLDGIGPGVRQTNLDHDRWGDFMVALAWAMSGLALGLVVVVAGGIVAAVV